MGASTRRHARSPRAGTPARRLLLLPTSLALAAGVFVLGRGGTEPALARDVPAAFTVVDGGAAPPAAHGAAPVPGGAAPGEGIAGAAAGSPSGPTGAPPRPIGSPTGPGGSAGAPALQQPPAVAPSPVPPTPTVTPPVADSIEEAQILQVLDLVFDMDVPFAQKAPYLEGSDQIAGLYDQFVVVGQQFGQLELLPRDVAAGADVAEFSFDAVLNGVTVREAIPGTAQRIGPAWQVTRSSMCEALALAGLTCPA